MNVFFSEEELSLEFLGIFKIIRDKSEQKSLTQRGYDIGLVTGTKIKLLFTSPSKKIKAYLIRDSIIAIRNSDASKIEVKRLND